MASVNSADIDLNLLRVLDALLDTGSVVVLLHDFIFAPGGVTVSRATSKVARRSFVCARREGTCSD